MKTEEPVVVIGGGATGMGILRDLALRGIRCMLIEQDELATGTSGRFHGLLHSGARYAVSDVHSAEECIRENRILKEIAPFCVEDTGGLFVQTLDDEPEYRLKWLEGCKKAGIPVNEVSPSDLMNGNNYLTRKIKSAYFVPDASVDGFMLVAANALSAIREGAEVKSYTKLTGLRIENNRITGLDVKNMQNGDVEHIKCSFVINAAGPWAGQVSELSGLKVPISPDKGIMLVFHHRISEKIINHLRYPQDGDIFVPHGNVTIFGTTSKLVDSPYDYDVNREDVVSLIEMGKTLIPEIYNIRIIRAFAGIRPLFSEEMSIQGRGATREFKMIDHENATGLNNMVSVFGGKLTTYRLMAENTVNYLSEKLNIKKPCKTGKNRIVNPVPDILQDLKKIICECERVTKDKIDQVADERENFSIGYLRRLTRLGMGPCQGIYCTLRAVSHLNERKKLNAGKSNRLILNDIQERWKGIKPVAWGAQARQSELARRIYIGLLGLDRLE